MCFAMFDTKRYSAGVESTLQSDKVTRKFWHVVMNCRKKSFIIILRERDICGMLTRKGGIGYKTAFVKKSLHIYIIYIYMCKCVSHAYKYRQTVEWKFNFNSYAIWNGEERIIDFPTCLFENVIKCIMIVSGVCTNEYYIKCTYIRMIFREVTIRKIMEGKKSFSIALLLQWKYTESFYLHE